MIPIQAHRINFILHYISPPSEIDQPLPSHLISKSLLQRHHFLGISPDDHQQYLSWPTSDQHQAVKLLESLQKPQDDEEYASYPTRYTSDGDYTYAHVHVSPADSQLRIIFQWDEGNGWTYHDASTMPFPPSSHDSLKDVSADLNAKGHQRVPSDQLSSEDAYWDAYGDSDGIMRDSHDDSAVAEVNGEDAYWAQYSSIQGSGDSTVPSPARRKFAQPKETEEPIEFSYASLHPATRPLSSDLPSPITLTHRLNAISPRRSRPPSPLLFDSEDCYTSDTVPTSLQDEVIHVKDLSPSSLSESMLPSNEQDVALKEAIKGIYRLWEAGKHKAMDGQDADEKNKEDFLSIVQGVIGQM